MPVALISTRTSPALGPSRSTSTISSGFLASNATAARVFISSSPMETPGLCLEEAPYPTRHASIVVRRIQRGDCAVRIRHDVVALFDQGFRKSGREFRMKLE